MRLLHVFLLGCAGIASALAAPPEKKSTFVVSPARDGEYAPWRAPEDAIKYYAGEVITLSGGEFSYYFRTDVVDDTAITPDWKGKLWKFKDHVYLDHPGVPFPYRITGYLDGVYVMTTWREFERWKKFGVMGEYDVLYLQTKKKANLESSVERSRHRTLDEQARKE